MPWDECGKNIKGHCLLEAWGFACLCGGPCRSLRISYKQTAPYTNESTASFIIMESVCSYTQIKLVKKIDSPSHYSVAHNHLHEGQETSN